MEISIRDIKPNTSRFTLRNIRGPSEVAVKENGDLVVPAFFLFFLRIPDLLRVRMAQISKPGSGDILNFGKALTPSLLALVVNISTLLFPENPAASPREHPTSHPPGASIASAFRSNTRRGRRKSRRRHIPDKFHRWKSNYRVIPGRRLSAYRDRSRLDAQRPPPEPCLPYLPCENQRRYRLGSRTHLYLP